MNKSKLKKIIRESFEGRHVGYKRFFPLDIKPDPVSSSETRPEDLDEGSDGNYMPKQNIESILKSAEIVSDHIKHDIEQEDWIEDKLSKTAENMRALRDFFENRDENHSHENDEGPEESPIVITKDMMKMLHEKGECDCSGHKLIYKNNGDNEVDEGIGISHAMKRGMNVPNTRSKNIKRGKNKKTANYPKLHK
jgi:hypothetical protein